LLIPLFLFSTTYYVRTDGNNGNTGLANTSGAAWLTIDYAAGQVSAGDTVYVNDGTYAESITMDASGTAENRIVFQAVNKKQVIIDGSQTGNGIYFSNRDYITITGFEIKEFNIGIYFYNGSNNNVVDSCKIHHMSTHGIYIRDSDYNTVRADSIYGSDMNESPTRGEVGVRVYNGDYNLIEYNYIHNMFADYANGDGVGLFQDSDYNVVRYNTIHHCPDDGLDCWSAPGSGNNGSYNLIEYNYIDSSGYSETNGTGMAGANGVGMKTNYETDHVIMRYNRVRYCVNTGISDEDSDGNNTFLQNVTWDNGNNWEIGAGANPSLRNNVSCGTNNSSGYFGVNGNVNQTNLTTAAAYFVDIVDFELASGSALIDAGTYFTEANGGGTGTSVTLDDARYFSDGNGLVTGDQIQIGTDTVTITDVNYGTNVITISRSITWVDNDDVSMIYYGSAQDVGVNESSEGSVSRTAWYLNGNASGTNNGASWTDGWETITDAVQDSLDPGDTLFVSGGVDSIVYTGALNIDASGTSGNPVVVIIGQESGYDGLAVFTSTVTISGEDYVTFSGRVGNGVEPHIKVRVPSGDGIRMYNCQSNIVEYVEVGPGGSGDQHHGIEVDEYVDGGNIIRNCKIHDIYKYGILVARPAGDINAGFTNYTHLTIQDNEIYNLGEDGVHAAGWAGGITLDGNNIHTQKTGVADYLDGMQLRGCRWLRVRNNWIHDLWSSDGVNGYIYVEADVAAHGIVGDNFHHIQVYNNLISCTDGGGFARGINFNMRAAQEIDDTGVFGSFNDILIANNTIVDMEAWGFQFQMWNVPAANISDVIIVNNIFYNNSIRSETGAVVAYDDVGSGVTFGSWGDAVDVIVDYNLVDNYNREASMSFDNNRQLYSAFATAQGTEDNGVIGSDPAFLDWSQRGVNAKSDLELASFDNTCIDAGVSLSSYFTEDNDGVGRPQGSIWDIGAWEYLGGDPQEPESPAPKDYIIGIPYITTD